MFARLLCALLAASAALASLPVPADAQFGIRRTFNEVVRAPARILPAPGRVVGSVTRSVFGVVATVAVGAAIFERLTRPEQREVARRAKTVVAKDPEQRVSDTYTSKDGKKQVTIVAEPMQKASELESDPAILVAADTVIAPPAKGATPPTGLASDTSTASDAKAPAPGPAAKPGASEQVVRISEIPPDTQCRKVTTELALRKKKGQKTADETNTNTAIFCQTAPGEWKPAST